MWPFSTSKSPKWELMLDLWSDDLDGPIHINRRFITWSTDPKWLNRKINAVLMERAQSNVFLGKRFAYKVEVEHHRGMDPRYGREIQIYRTEKKGLPVWS